MATLLDLQAEKQKLEGKLKELTAEYKSKADKIKGKILVVDTEIFKAETGIYAEAARRAAATDPKFMELVKREIERAELEAKTPKAKAKAKS